MQSAKYGATLFDCMCVASSLELGTKWSATSTLHQRLWEPPAFLREPRASPSRWRPCVSSECQCLFSELAGPPYFDHVGGVAFLSIS